MSDSRLAQPEAFGDVYRRHHAGVFHAAHRVLHDAVLAEDIAQDVFLALWSRPDRFDARRGDLGAYLRLMARSRAVDSWRSSRSSARAQERLMDVERRTPRPEDDTAGAIEHRERCAELTAAVSRLPDPQREAVALAFWGDMPASEVAARTSVPLGTAKSRLRLGLARLRAEVGGPVGQPTGA